VKKKMNKVKLKNIAKCPKCGREHVRQFPIDLMVCKCGNPTLTVLPMHLEMVLPEQLYVRFTRLSNLSGIPIRQLVNTMLAEALKARREKAITESVRV
jgi:hypothetical protein